MGRGRPFHSLAISNNISARLKLQDSRQRLIVELKNLLAQLQNEEAPLDEIEARLWNYLNGYHVHCQLRDIQAEVRMLRKEVHHSKHEPVRCAYSEDQGQYIKLLTGIGGNSDQDKKYLKKKSHSNDWMIITDPYFLQWNGPNKAFGTEKKYTEFIIDFIPEDLKKLELFILPGPNKRIFKKFNDRVLARGTRVSYRETTEIHDRTIIRDNNTATLMGTSFGGYSNKLSFVLDIPPKDLENFMAELKRIRDA